MTGMTELPPQNLQAEMSVIGGLLLDGKCFDRVQGVVSVDDFYRPEHRIIFHAIGQLYQDGAAVDVITVDEFLQGNGLSEKVGGLAALATMAKDTPSTANIVTYAEIVREKAVLRMIIDTAGELAELARAGGRKSAELIAEAEAKIFKLGQHGLRGKRGFVRLNEVLRGVVETMEEQYENPPKDGVMGQATGFNELDAMTSGHAPGDLVIIGARPAMGKTSFAMNIAEHVAVRDELPVAVFSLEMQADQLAQRMLASGGAPLKVVREPWLIRDEQWPLITASMSKLSQAPVFIDDTGGLTLADVRSRTLRLISQISTEFPDGLGAVFVDYIQLMQSSGQYDNRNNQVEEITRGLKMLAKEIGSPVFALSQLNRGLESRPNKRPMMADLRDSGGIEQDADVVLFLYRDEVYNPETVDQGIAEVIIGKSRNGPLGKVKLAFDGARTRFLNLSDRHNE